MIRLRAALAALGVVFAVEAQAETWTIASLRWPPYSGAELKHQGAGIHVLRTALKRIGVELDVVYLPWRRAQAVARQRDAVVGYYPAWPSEVAHGFFPSAPVFTSPLGFAERTSDPISWQRLSDLRGKRIGFVRDYVYPDRLRKAAQAGIIQRVPVRTDLAGLRFLHLGRVDAHAIDAHVMHYLLQTESVLASVAPDIDFDARTVARMDLVVAFEKNRENVVRAARLREALAGIDSRHVIARYLERWHGEAAQ